MRVPEALELLGNFARRSELLALGCNEQLLDLSLYYRKILRVRVGQYASVGTPEAILKALRVGGRLACVSAIAYHAGEDANVEPIHVLVKYGASRLGGSGNEIVHWTRHEVAGTRLVVSVEAAARQVQICRALREHEGKADTALAKKPRATTPD